MNPTKEMVRDIQRSLLKANVEVHRILKLSKNMERRALEKKSLSGLSHNHHSLLQQRCGEVEHYIIVPIPKFCNAYYSPLSSSRIPTPTSLTTMCTTTDTTIYGELMVVHTSHCSVNLFYYEWHGVNDNRIVRCMQPLLGGALVLSLF